MGLVPPAESMRMLEKISPVLMFTDATFCIAILSSFDPMARGLMRRTRSRLTSMTVGKSMFPAVQRLAVKRSLIGRALQGHIFIHSCCLLWAQHQPSHGAHKS